MALNEEWQKAHGKPLIPEPCQGTVYAPVGFAMWRPMAEALGWPNAPIGWDTLLALMNDPQGWGSKGRPEWGAFKFGHTDPNSSNSGLLLLSALAYSVWDIRQGLTYEMVKSDPYIDAMRTVELHTYHYGDKSRENVVRMIEEGGAFLHATNTSEAETILANLGEYGDPGQGLAFIFPSDGEIWPEHPYCALDGDWVSAEQKEAAQLFEAYLHERPQQELAVANRLRPSDLGIPVGPPFTEANGTLPNKTPTTAAALESPKPDVLVGVQEIFDRTRRQRTVFLLLDTSTSMNGAKLKLAVEAAAQFVERMGRDDEIYVSLFGGKVQDLDSSGRAGDVQDELPGRLRNLIAGGSTYLHDGICQAAAQVDVLRADDAAEGGPLYAIVVLSDGDDTNSEHTYTDVLKLCVPAGEEALGVKVFTIAYGTTCLINGKDPTFLSEVAKQTGGVCYDSGPDEILELMLEKILYQ
jgi:Ca-activated chloride channel family protein